MKHNSVNVLQPPSALGSIESSYLPNNVSFDLINPEGDVVLTQNSSKNELVTNILDQFDTNASEIPIPVCAGVRFSYLSAVAKSILELNDTVDNGLHNAGLKKENVKFKTIIKDGGDGMGEVLIHKEKSDSMLPDKAFRFSFCIVKMMAISDGTCITVYENEKPNSVRTNRPLLEAIVDENNKVSNILCTKPIELERKLMIDNVMRIHSDNGVFQDHQLCFYNTMVDEKRDRADAGLQGSGSRYLCR